MAMEAVDEPSKWICRLESKFRDGSLLLGTGFLVNIPSDKFCIMTAGHNIADKELGRATSITLDFPSGLVIYANPDECFVSEIYSQNPASESSEETSTSDYGLIAVDRKKLDQSNLRLNPGGCAFNALLSNQTLLRQEVSVHGYKGKDQEEKSHPLQTKSTSKLKRIDNVSLYYTKDTAQGVSGGPVFVSIDGHNTAVGIHNYRSRATRLTFRVMLEILGWVTDYKLRRSLEVKPTKGGTQSDGVYLQATKGSHPNIIARPILAYLNFILVDVTKKVPDIPPNRISTYERFVILRDGELPAQDIRSLDKRFHLLSADETEQSVAFSEATTVPKGENIFTIKFGGSIVLSETQYSLKVLPSDRVEQCDCGCITQDQIVGLEKGKGTTFRIT